MIRATVIADSINQGARLAALELCYPRVIHAELLTHRAFSRNASSSRAIPWERMRAWVEENPYVPIHWGRNQKGMQATEELSGLDKLAAETRWDLALQNALDHADALHRLGVHKQIVNRLLEPFAHINVLVSATDFGNFFNLRIHKDAMPEIQALAVAMARALEASTPVDRSRDKGDRPDEFHWHLPYVTDEERAALPVEHLAKVSSARCARISYKTHDGRVPTLDEDLALYDRLVGSDPKHASPTEHQALAAYSPRFHSGNFTGWSQFRQHIPGESASLSFNWKARLREWDGVEFRV